MATPMHIGVEASKLVRERRGIGRYVRNVLRHLPQVRPGVRLTLFLKSMADEAAVREQLTALDETLLTHCRFAPLSALPNTDADVVWYPWNWLHPQAGRAAMVTTICDLVPMLQLDHRWWKVIKRAKYRRRFRRTAEFSDLLITISAFTAHEVERYLGVPFAQMRVTLLAADDLATHTDAPATTPEKLGVVGPFFMAVGAQEARKNLQVLFRAMALLHARGVTAPLILCGPGGPLASIAKRERAPWLRFAGYVSDAELGAMYRAATALVFPSRYEGFGLPALEAMAAGGRVICANASSLPEVVGNAALTFEWNDAEALAAHMQRLLDDPVERQAKAQSALAQASRFTWAQTASETLDAFDEAARRAAVRRGAVSSTSARS
ncbi:MAG: glycosyltransferase family 4 protein [Gemmatimonadaceae bacterium]|nr:glycosyltransferase family 4 protein [Gemmatimonadaceae bacterium]